MHLEPDNEADRLSERYGALSDDDLLDLNNDFDNLTDDAQQALKAEMRRRRLKILVADAGVEEPRRANDYEFDLIKQQEKDGLVDLWGFESGFDLRFACGYLSDAGIDLAIEEHESDRYPSHDILVAPADVEQAKQVLRDKMGLFPLPVTAAPQLEGKGFIDDGEPLTLGQFDDRDEAEQTALILANAGIEYKLIPPDPDEYEPAFFIDVHANDFNRALELVTKGLGVE
jgi:hypothetical protein